MYEFIHARGNAYYIESPSKVGVFRLSDGEVCLIDSGNNRDMGKRIKKILDSEGLWLKSIYITLSFVFEYSRIRVFISL